MFRFTKAGAVHASSVDIENAAASALAGLSPGATFLALAGDDGLEHLLVTDDAAGQESVAFGIARAIAARSNEVDEMPNLMPSGRAQRIAVLTARQRAEPQQDTQAGAEFTALSRIVGDLLMPGEWFALSVRKPATRSEVPRNRTWLDHFGMRTHHSRKNGAVAAQFFAGSHTADRARDLVIRIATAIPGFGVVVSAKTVSPAPQAALFAVLSCAAAAIALAWPKVSEILPFDFGTGIEPFVSPGGFSLAAIGMLAAIGTAAGLVTSFAKRVREHARFARVPAAPHRIRPPKSPRKATTARRQRGLDETNRPVFEDVEVPEFIGDYPLHPQAFLIGPHVPLAVVAPHAESSGSASTMARLVPAELRIRVGPQLGKSTADSETMAHLSVGDLWSGIGLIGAPGSGKTAFMEHLWAHASRERVNPSGIPATPARHALIAFDTKGGGEASDQYKAWSDHVGDRALVIQFAEPDARTSIELFPDRGEPADIWGRQVADAMKYVWGDAIQDRSFDTLWRVLAAAKLVTPAIASRVDAPALDPLASPIYFADVLLTNRGDDAGVKLFAALSEAAVIVEEQAANASAELARLVDAARGEGLSDEEIHLDERIAHANLEAVRLQRAVKDLPDAVSALGPLYGPARTPTQRATLAEAPRTKIAALMAAEPFFSRPKRLPWKLALEHHMAVIINTGAGPSGIKPDETLREVMSGLMLYTLAEEIKRSCIGWFEQGRAVSIFSDEVKHIAAVSADVVQWMRNDARSNGVRPVFATQTPGTLVPEVRRAMLGFGNLVLWRQDDATTANELVTELSLSGGEWSTSDVVNLDEYHAIARATSGGKRLEPFTITVPNFRAQREDGTWRG